MENKQILILWVENKPGVLSKISSLCRRKRYNIKSITAGETHRENITHITITFQKEQRRIQNIIDQLDNLIEVLTIEMVEKDNKVVINKEMVLLITKDEKTAVEILKKAKNLNVKIFEHKNTKVAVEIIANGSAIEEFVKKQDMKNIYKLVRSGLIAINF